MLKIKQLHFWIFTISILLALTLPTLVKDGMFMDGMLYSCVANNLSNGIGSFWFPHYSSTLYPFFDQQPPLGFGIQSLFFTVLGHSIYVERFYSLLTALITVCLIVNLWRLIFKGESSIKNTSWFPVLLWITIPVCYWSYSNNMLENTMAVFDLASIIFIVKYLFGNQKLKYLVLAGLFIFFATLSKGIQGLFPIAAIFFAWVAYRNISLKKMVFASFLLVIVPAVIYGLLLLNPTIFDSLSTYFTHRVLNSIKNVVAVNNRFYLASRLLSELIPAVILTVILIFFAQRKMKKDGVAFQIPYFKHILFFLLTGISASFPLMVTMEQRGFYLVTSLPYFALSIALVSVTGLAYLIGKINLGSIYYKAFKGFSILFFFGVLTYSFLQIGKNSRDDEMLNDVYLIGSVLPHGTVVGSTNKLWHDWPLQEYLVRHYYICLDDTILNTNQFIIVESTNDIPIGLKTEKATIPTLKYHLYKILN